MPVAKAGSPPFLSPERGAADRKPTPERLRVTNLYLPDSLDITLAAAFKETLDELLQGESIEIDGSQVERVDGCALQLLVAFVQEARLRSIALTWVAPSAALCRAASCLGLSGVLALADGSPPGNHP